MWLNMGVAAPRAPVEGWSSGPLKSLGTGPSLPVNCYLENQFHKKVRVNHPLPPPPLNDTLNYPIIG